MLSCHEIAICQKVFLKFSLKFQQYLSENYTSNDGEEHVEFFSNFGYYHKPMHSLEIRILFLMVLKSTKQMFFSNVVKYFLNNYVSEDSVFSPDYIDTFSYSEGAVIWPISSSKCYGS